MQPGGVHLQPLNLPVESTGFRGLGTWRYRTETAAPPASGQVRFNNADPTLATELYMSETNDGGTDVSAFLDLLNDGALIYLQEQSDSDNHFIIEISSNVDSGTYRTFGIENIVLEGVEPSQNTPMLCVVSQSGAGGGNVFKVGTPVDNEIGVWTGDGTIEGDSNFTWNGAVGLLNIGSSVSPGLGASQLVAILYKQADGVQLGAFGFANTADFQIINNNHGSNILISGEDAGGTAIAYWILDPDNLKNHSLQPIYMTGQAAQGLSFLNQGHYWVRDDAPTTPMFTNSFGTDFELNDGDVNAVFDAAEFRIAVFDGSLDILGDANFTYGLNAHPEQMMIQVVTNTVNDVGLLIIDSDSVLNPFGWGILPGQAGLHDGTLIITNEPPDAVNNRAMTILPGSATTFGYGAAVANNVAFQSETAGALAFFMPIDNTGREETKISGVGEVGGTGHEGLLSVEVYAYGDLGLQFSRQVQFVLDADGRIHADFYGSLQLGIGGLEAPLEAGDNAAIGYSQANGLELIGQGTDNDFVIFDDTHQLALSKPTGTTAFRFHQRFAPTRFTEFQQGDDDFLITSTANVADFLISGYSGLLDIASDLTVEGIRPSGTVEWDKGADIASATTLVLGSDGNSFDVTGTTDIEAISAKPIGTVIILTFDAVARMIHDATALDMSGDVDMVPEANDTLGMICYDGVNWRELFRTDGQNVRSSGNIDDRSVTVGNGGAKRITDTGVFIGDDDELILASSVILASFTDAELNDNGNSVNTNDGKQLGAMVFNSSQGHAVTAQGSGSGDVWNDGVGTTVNTPV